MKVDVSKITDSGLATALCDLGKAVERKFNKPKWRPHPHQPPDRNEPYYRQGGPELARATQLRDAQRLGEKRED